MKIACLLIQIGVCFGGLALNWHLFGWQAAAVTVTTGVIATFFSGLAKRLPS